MQPDASGCRGSKRPLEGDAAAEEPSNKAACAPAAQLCQQPIQWTAELLESLTNYLLSLPIASQLMLMQQCIVEEALLSAGAAPAATPAGGGAVTLGPAAEVVQQKPVELPYMRPAPAGSKTLVLCMVYAAPTKKHATSHGQEGRDYMRLKSLEDTANCVAYTVDDRHEPARALPGRHLRASFKNARRFLAALKEQWAGQQFHTCIFDYFWIPPAWSAQRWGVVLVAEIFPVLARDYGVRHFWLPNCEAIVDMLQLTENQRADHKFTVYNVPTEHVHCNPLFAATSEIDEELAQLPDRRTNANQMRFLDSNEPFIFIHSAEATPADDIAVRLKILEDGRPVVVS